MSPPRSTRRRRPAGWTGPCPQSTWLLAASGSSLGAGDLANCSVPQYQTPPRRAYHPMTQGKIERWHQTLKNRILLENYFLPSDLEAQIAAFVADYNDCRYHESINNLTPADNFFGRMMDILAERERIKRQTIEYPSGVGRSSGGGRDHRRFDA